MSEEQIMGTDLATEIMHELKASARRWFIIAIAELVIILGLVAGIIWYLCLPQEQSSTTVTQEGENLTETQFIGGDYNGESETDSD